MSARLVSTCRVVLARLILACLAFSTASCATLPGPRLDRSQLELAFDEEFDRPPTFYDAKKAPNGRWKTNFFFSIQDTQDSRGWESRTLRPNKEMEYYGDPLAGMNPFEWQRGHLVIVAKRNPHEQDPRTGGLPYLSGLLTTEKSFNQLYGYFEVRATMPVGKGLWPGFWLLPQPKMVKGWAQATGQQEIDVVENIGKRDEVWLTVHNDVNGKKVGDGEKFTQIRIDRPHTYGLLLTKDEIVWYIDDHEVRRRPNRDFHEPAYMIVQLGVGGDWPGPPDETTRFPVRMKVDWIRAWRLRQR